MGLEEGNPLHVVEYTMTDGCTADLQWLLTLLGCGEQ
jgi:hypothetical protein